jgi:hypothetical protein
MVSTITFGVPMAWARLLFLIPLNILLPIDGAWLDILARLVVSNRNGLRMELVSA